MTVSIEAALDLERFPLDRPESDAFAALVARCREDLEQKGLFNLEGFLKPEVAQDIASACAPRYEREAFTHARIHNIYFEEKLPGLEQDHPALATFETVNHTLCGDQLAASPLTALYEWPPLLRFLEQVMAKPALHCMTDPLARVNLMLYGEGEALNWHFDRSEFTTTLLIQAPEAGGEFQYRRDLRSHADPNYEGVAKLLAGDDSQVERLTLAPGSLNVFKGLNTAHRVTPVKGARPRMVAVFSYYERPGVLFTAEEQLGFYGRSVRA
jgi:hypothetical protein